jgi:CelD/BcsL family acetyltransferase involved in cellulose biosynthesis
VTEHEVAMVLELPESVDGFYEMVGKKERHELRRKRRRYQGEVGPVEFTTEWGAGFAMDEFIRLHRLSEGRKGEFMTPTREAFFRRLAGQPGWRVDSLVHEGRATASLFAWVDGNTYYLYNSSYDPRYMHASPGMVALATMIEAAIIEEITYFDFLKGAESYKSRLGATPRPLYKIEALVPEGLR